MTLTVRSGCCGCSGPGPWGEDPLVTVREVEQFLNDAIPVHRNPIMYGGGATSGRIP